MVAIAAAVVVVAAACSAPAHVATPPTAGAARTPTSAPPKHAVQLVRETPIPARPTAASAIARWGTHTVVQRGTLYNADFRLRSGTYEVPTPWPVPWPDSANVDLSATLTFALGTNAVPDYVGVRWWTHVSADGNRTPEPLPTAIYECYRFASPRCQLTKSSRGLEIGLNATVLTADYVSVFCTWHIPASQRQQGANAPADAAATWLFQLHRYATPEGAGS